MGQVEEASQAAPGNALAGDRIGEQLLIAAELGFGLQHFQLGGHPSLEAGPGISQTHQGRPHGPLADTNLIVRELQLEIGLGGLQTQLPQGDQILILGLLELIASRGDLGNPLGIDQGPVDSQTAPGSPQARATYPRRCGIKGPIGQTIIGFSIKKTRQVRCRQAQRWIPG